MTIEQAIKKAIECEWQYEEGAPDEVMYKWKVFCDPLFWQSLGKAIGWEEHWYYGWFVKKVHGGSWEWRQGKDSEVFWGGSSSEMPTSRL